ncbi:MAG: hypothetical protein GWO02_01295 [Gammaproteobacteria bacterium]|nr:hypothetical protein [Gammaproteobacteria bacterium]
MQRSHRSALDERLANAKIANGEHWAKRHRAAVEAPRGIEAPILAMARALADYADQYPDALDGAPRLGDDGVIGDDYWSGIARRVILLLNGPTGRLDAAAVDSAIRALATDCGVEME